MRRLAATAALIIALPILSFAGETNKLWFPVGERLTYQLYWGIIPVGQASLSTGWTNHNGRMLLAVTATARSGAVLSKIYPINDHVEALVDPATFLPIVYVQDLSEGRHRRHDTTTFYHRIGRATCVSLHPPRTNHLEIAQDTRDVLSLAYFMRSKDFAGNEEMKYKVLVDDKLYDMDLNMLGEEKVRVDDFGKVKCFKVEPKAKFGEIFVRKGKVFIWFSSDPRHICVRVTGKMPVADVKAILVKLEGEGSSEWPVKE